MSRIPKMYFIDTHFSSIEFYVLTPICAIEFASIKLSSDMLLFHEVLLVTETWVWCKKFTTVVLVHGIMDIPNLILHCSAPPNSSG